MSSSINHRPKYKYFQKLRENLCNNNKLLKFKKRKWIDLIKRLNQSSKYNFFNHDLHHVSRRVKTLRYSYRAQLFTRQKLKIYYGNLPNALLKNLCKKALVKSKLKSAKKKASEFLLLSLESRLDIVLYRSYFALSVNSARQLIIHGNILINYKKITLSNFILKQGDLVQITDNGKQLIAKNIRKSIVWPLPPAHLEISFKTLSFYFIENMKFTHLSNCYSFWLNLKSVFSFYEN
jgi:ribosomal protein S4